MAITIDASVGGSSSNSFCTEAEQIAYMATRLNASAWTTVTGSTCTEDEKKAMVEATREISSLTGWEGQRVTETQSLSWPRYYASNPDSGLGLWYLETVIPQRVKDATCELAFQFLNAGTTDIAALDSTLNVIEKTVDVLTTRYAEPYQRAQGLRRYPRVWKYLSPLIGSSGNQTEIVRG